MPLVNGNILLSSIQEKRVLAGAFNTTNLETTISILDAIERSGLPNFIQIAPTNAKLSGYDYIYEIVKKRAATMDVPVSLHLDHGKELDDVKQAVRAGFTSVMIDGAELPFEENIAFTKAAVDFCKSFGVPVEAELGAILGKEDDHVSEADCKTDPKQVLRFVQETGCSMLAVSVGNVHGLEDIPRIDIPLLKEIAAICPVPLVIHGGSGIDEEIIRSFVKYNVVKVNIASDLRKAFITSVGRAWTENNNEANLAHVMNSAKAAVEADVFSKIQMMNRAS
ncbi:MULTISPECIES: class II aldolase [Rahnella]|uniref:Class II aldolase n=1 Tax=Rahnella victoriana TaxID=1510570 RepID=A0ABS0DVN2_9GAMM|nr:MULTISPECIES: class II aldolase [Rahnella]MBF7957941.1 class II aldolase [Rahnella victoriana]PBI77872.1 fructose-1,6-bisphosphate aldolase [Rahnella victoriana]TDS98250.1 fructose-bisphosphate aldolase [Rahnella sp. BIGb0236]VTQ52133.1 fructose-bisphosphate aldolase [Campylobacter jejuni]